MLAGPYATMLLADMGAEVIKVESPAGDDTRHWVPPLRGDLGTYYAAVNRNKRSIVLEPVRRRRPCSRCQALSARSDVMIQNFKPGGLKRFGLDYDSVATRNPASIYCSISGFGADKGASLPGYDLLVQAVSGLMSLTGSPDGPPYRAGISVFDVMTGLHSAIGHPRRACTTATSPAPANTSRPTCCPRRCPPWSTRPPPTSPATSSRTGWATPTCRCSPTNRCRTGDGELIVIAGNDGQFRKLAAALDVAELADDPRFASVGLQQRQPRTVASHPAQSDWRPPSRLGEWFDVLSAAGIPCGPINDVRGGVELAEQLGLEPVAVAGGVPTVRNPIRFSSERRRGTTSLLRHWTSTAPRSARGSASPATRQRSE